METAFQSILKVSGQAAVVAVLVLVVQRIFRDQLSKAWRHALWFLVVLRLVVPVLPESQMSVFNVVKYEPSEAKPVIAEPVPHVGNIAPVQAPPANTPPPAAEIAPVPVSPVASASQPINYWATLAWAWLIVLLLAASWMLLGHVLFCRRLRNNRPIEDERFLRLFDECREVSGCHASISLEETDAVASPALYGVFRTRLLLPKGLAERFNDEELRYIILHELAHVRRADVLTAWAITFLGLLHWFNPLLLFAFSRMKADRELACDELALSWTQEGKQEAYGQTVIKLLENFATPASAPGVIGILERKSRMKLRLRMIAGFTNARRWSIGAVTLLCAMCAVSLTEVKSPERNRAAAAGDDNWSEDRQRMTKILTALQAYRAAHEQEWPEHLSSLVPAYLAQEDLLSHDDVELKTLVSKADIKVRIPDPKLPVAYDYLFSATRLTAEQRFGAYGEDATHREVSRVMEERFGGKAPVLRVTRGEDSLGLMINGEFFGGQFGQDMMGGAVQPLSKEHIARKISVTLVDAVTKAPVSAAKVVGMYHDERGLFPPTVAHTNEKGIALVPLATKEPLGMGLIFSRSGYVEDSEYWDADELGNLETQTLLKLNAVGGTIQDKSGQPVAGARIHARRWQQPQWKPNTPGVTEAREFKAVSDDQGRWAIHDLPVAYEWLDFIVAHPDFGTTMFGVYEKPEKNRFYYHPMLLGQELISGKAVMTLHAGFTLSGRTIDQDGKPIASATIVVSPPAGNELKFSSDTQGRFTLPNLHVAMTNRWGTSHTKTEISVAAPGYAYFTTTLNTTNSQAGLEFRLRPAASFRPTVIDRETREPIQGVWVRFNGPHSHQHAWQGATDARGRVQYTNAPVTASYHFSRPGYYSLIKECSLNEVIELQRPLQFSGTVVDHTTGKPIPSFSARLVGWDGGQWHVSEGGQTERFTGGKFHFEDQARPTGKLRGTYRVEVTAPGYGRYLSAEFPGTNGSQRLVARLSQGRNLNGRILDPEGRPLAGAEVVEKIQNSTTALLRGDIWESKEQARTTTDPDGRFQIMLATTNETVYVGHRQKGFARVSVTSFKNGSDIRLAPWGHMKGSVKINGRVPPESYLGLADQQNRGFLMQTANNRTDKEGNLKITHLPPGRYFLEYNDFKQAVKLNEILEIRPGETTRLDLDLNLQTLQADIQVAELDINNDWRNHRFSLRPLKTKASFAGEGRTPYHSIGWIPFYPGEPVQTYSFPEGGGINVDNVQPGEYELLIALLKGQEEISWAGKFYHFKQVVTVGSGGVTKLGKLQINSDNAKIYVDKRN